MPSDIIYVVDSHTAAFEQARTAIDVVCAGDSLTGWNNFGSVYEWPYPTYPLYLDEMCRPLKLKIANGGIAGEISRNGVGQVRDYLTLFPKARYFIIGYGTNDLGMWPDTERTSQQIVAHLAQMVQAVREQVRQPILFNIPYANEAMFMPLVAQESHEKRDYHNGRLRAFCSENRIPLADICSRLHDEHFGDELHPNAAGARIIAEEVFAVLRALVGSATDVEGRFRP
jgi:lysophospholipase L1-like esterase